MFEIGVYFKKQFNKGQSSSELLSITHYDLEYVKIGPEDTE